MKANNGSITQLPNAGEAASVRNLRAAEQPQEDPEIAHYSRLLERFRQGAAIDAGVFLRLAERLRVESDPARLWFLLSCLEYAPEPRLPLEERFAALVRLTTADSVILRVAAYGWLAGLHRQDLRFEIRAKKVLRQGLDREFGLARTRLKQLLRSC